MNALLDVIEGRLRWVVEQGDCLDVLRALPDGSVDAVVCDPPYCSGGATEAGRGRAAGQGLRSETLSSGRFGWFDTDNMTTGGLVWLLRSCAVEWMRALPDGGSAVVFCDWRMAPTLAPALESSGLRYQNLLVWDKGSMGLGRGFRMQHELALHLTKGVGRYHDKATGNVIGDKRPGASREHPTQKPVELMSKILRVVAPPGGLVLDPFAGSGTTGVACVRDGFRFIGVERSPEYADIARARIVGAAQPVAQPALPGVA